MAVSKSSRKPGNVHQEPTITAGNLETWLDDLRDLVGDVVSAKDAIATIAPDLEETCATSKNTREDYSRLQGIIGLTGRQGDLLSRMDALISMAMDGLENLRDQAVQPDEIYSDMPETQLARLLVEHLDRSESESRDNFWDALNEERPDLFPVNMEEMKPIVERTMMFVAKREVSHVS